MSAKPSLATAERNAIRTELKEVNKLEREMKSTLRKDLAEADRNIAKWNRHKKVLESGARRVLDGCEHRRALLQGRLS